MMQVASLTVTPEYRWYGGRTSLAVFLLVVLVGMATEGGLTGAIAGVSAVVVIATLLSTKFDLLDISVILLPVMFYISAGTKINVSLADFLLPLLAFKAFQIHMKSKNDLRGKIVGRVAAFLFLIVIVLLCSFLAAGVSPFVGLDFTRGVVEFSKIVICMVYALVYLILIWSRLQENDVRFLQVWTWSAVSVAVMAVASLFVVVPGFEPYSKSRASASFEDPNLLGMYLLTSIGVVICYSWLRYRRPVRFNMIAVVLGIISTGSRASLIVLAIGLVAFVVGYGFLYLRFDLFLFGIVTICAVSSPLWWSSIAGGALTRSSESLVEDVRFDLWDMALSTWMDNFFFGVGYGQFPLVVARLRNSEGGNLVHNTFLSFAVETGFVGVTIVVVAFVATFVLVMARAKASVALFGLGLGYLLMSVSMMSVNGQNTRFVWVYVVCAVVFATLFNLGRQNSAGPVGILLPRVEPDARRGSRTG